MAYCWLIDWVAFNSAHLTLLDTDARKKYVMRKFFIPEKKLARLWSGVDNTIFVYNQAIQKLPVFTVLFRGALMNEAGIEYLIQAANLLKNEPINFRIIGSGVNAPLLTKMLTELKLKNVEWISERLSWEDLIKKTQECHISIGQLSDHWRQNLHITFKTIESMALKIPYVMTNNSYGMLEFLKDNETCFLINPEDSPNLTQKIL